MRRTSVLRYLFAMLLFGMVIPGLVRPETISSPSQGGTASENVPREKLKEATALDAKAVQLHESGKYGEAIAAAQRALEIREAFLRPDHPDVAASLNHLGKSYTATARYAEAEPLFTRALKIDEKVHEKILGNEHPSVATDLDNLAGLYERTGRYVEAGPLYTRALSIAQHAGDPDLLRSVQANYSSLLQRQGNPNAAIFFGKQAVNTIQRMRSSIFHLGRETLRRSTATVDGTYRNLADLLIDEGRLSKAQQVIGMLKEEEYFDFVRWDSNEAPSSKRVSMTARETVLDYRYRMERTSLAYLDGMNGARGAMESHESALKERGRLGGEGESLTPDTRLEQIDRQMEAANAAVVKVVEEIEQELKTPRKDKVNEIKEAEGLMEDLRELGEGAVVVYTPMEEKTFRSILIGPDFRKAYEYPIGEKELTSKICAFLGFIAPPSHDPREKAKELYAIIVKPFEEDLRTLRAKTLVWSLDGALRYLPMAALFDGKSCLAEHYRNVMFTLASQARWKDAPKASWRCLGLRVSKVYGGFPPLPNVPSELEGIVKKGSSRGIFPGTINLDEEFTWDTMRKELEGRSFPLVHIASHFKFSPGNDTTSYLFLGDGKTLTLSDVKSKKNLFGGVDLLTLSAFETALGDAGREEGKEVEGFAVLAQRNGTKALIVTLWPVADKSTALFMRTFYRMRETEKLSKAEAIRRTQEMFIRGKMEGGGSGKREEEITSSVKTSFTPDPDAPYSHPYFWAPFVLIGNWR